MKKHILFLIRRKLGLKRGERFQFANQASDVNKYYFTASALMKECYDRGYRYERPANVKLNYILSDECKIVKCEKLSER